VIQGNRTMFSALALALLASAAQAQLAVPPPPPPPGAIAAPTAAVALYAPPQLDQMLASIALYPDPLLSQILAAATYPYEVDEAARWLDAPANAALSDGPLDAALAGIDWDPSVKSLVPFPQILRMLDQHLDWTQALGNAFLAQQADVMDSIQRLRHEALARGDLVSSAYQTVTVDGPYVEIEPAQPQAVFIPVYNPQTVYGAWPYPAYPPIYFGPPPGLGVSFAAGGLGFSIGIGVVDLLWHWGDWDWRGHDIRIDRDRFNRINARGPSVTSTTWRHDPVHRRAVPYGSPQVRAAYEPKLPGSPAQRQQYRFFSTPQQPATVPAARPQEHAPPPTAMPPQRQPTPQQLPARPVPPQPRQTAPSRPVAPPPSTAFQPMARGPEAEAAARRGHESRTSTAATARRPVPAPQSAPAARPAPPQPQPAPHSPPPRRNPEAGEHRP